MGSKWNKPGVRIKQIVTEAQKELGERMNEILNEQLQGPKALSRIMAVGTSRLSLW